MRIRRWQYPLIMAAVTLHLANSGKPGSGTAFAVDPVVIETMPFDDPVMAESSPSDHASSYFNPDGPLAIVPLAKPITMESGSSQPLSPQPCKCRRTCSCQQIRCAADSMRTAYRCLFFDNDFSYLNDPCYKGRRYPGDCMKGLHQRLDLGGEARVRFQDDNNIYGSGLSGVSDDYWLTRVRLYADYRMNDWFRIYGEYLHGNSGGELFPTLPGNQSSGRIQNGFLDTRLTEYLTLRLGRQEQSYGSQRLVSPLDWVNDRRTFDGVKAIYDNPQWKVDTFFLHPVHQSSATTSGTNTDEAVDFYGIYARRKHGVQGSLDAYYFGLNNSREAFDYQTIGMHLRGELDSGTLYAIESAYQFGKNSPGYGNHSAAFVTAGLGHRLKNLLRHNQGESTLWLWYDWASGDDVVPAVRGDNGFDALFPQSHWYLGFMDLFGRRNINDVNLQFTTPLMGSKVQLVLWYHYFFLDQKTTPYNVDMTAFNPNNQAADRELGQELDVLFNVTLNPRNRLLLGYSFFRSGKYYELTPGVPTDADAQFMYLQYQTRF